MSTDLHPDIVRAITGLSNSKLGRRYDKMSRRRYGVSGAILAGKTVAGEFGGRSTKAGRGVVSSAGARGPAQFIPSTREAYIKQYGVDPWAGDKQAIKGLMLHQLNTGVEGYNPGDPNYRDYIMGQKLNRPDRRTLRSAKRGRSTARGTRTQVEQTSQTTPGQSFEQERQAARTALLLGGHITLDKLIDYKASINSMQDVPAQTVPTGLKVTRTQSRPAAPAGRAQPVKADGKIFEVFYDPLGHYWDSGAVQRGAIGGHSDHVHVSASRATVIKLGKLAQSMGLKVSGQSYFDGSVPTSGHVEGSYHYKDEAIDVSGTPALQAKFARIAMKAARNGRAQ